ncbi:MAG: restriction endonuclease [Verrucomicrobiales bacterium]
MSSRTPPPALSDARVWSLELLQQMDWRRFHELVHSILHRRGYKAWPYRSGADGARTVQLIRYDAKTHQPDGLAHLAGWNGMAPTANELRTLLDHQLAAGILRSYYVTPGRFDEEAVIFGRKATLVLIDGRGLLEMVSRLPDDDQKSLLQLATWGDWSVPTCPTCGIKLVLRDSEVPPHAGPLDDAEYWFEETVTAERRVGTLAIRVGAKVHFQKPIHAREILIEGRATGIFLCNGRVVIAPGAVLTGQVAARAIDIRKGGVMDGDATIIASGEVKPASGLPARLIWGCPLYPACKLFFEVRET